MEWLLLSSGADESQVADKCSRRRETRSENAFQAGRRESAQVQEIDPVSAGALLPVPVGLSGLWKRVYEITRKAFQTTLELERYRGLK